jgi:hypothetical protein
MPTAANIVVNDSVPVAHTYEPISVLPERTRLVDKTSSTSAGFGVIQVGLSESRSNRPTNRVSLKFSVPTEQTVDSVTTVAYTARCNADFILPEQMTQVEREDFITMFGGIVIDPLVFNYIADLDPMY